jgi:hypothetical protein
MRPFILPLEDSEVWDPECPYLEVEVPLDAREASDDTFATYLDPVDGETGQRRTIKPVCWAAFDSRFRMPLYRGDRIVIRRAREIVRTIEAVEQEDWRWEQEQVVGLGADDDIDAAWDNAVGGQDRKKGML